MIKDSVVNGIVPKDKSTPVAAEKDIAMQQKREMNGGVCTLDKGGDSAPRLNLINPFVHSLAPETAIESIQVGGDEEMIWLINKIQLNCCIAIAAEMQFRSREREKEEYIHSNSVYAAQKNRRAPPLSRCKYVYIHK